MRGGCAERASSHTIFAFRTSILSSYSCFVVLILLLSIVSFAMVSSIDATFSVNAAEICFSSSSFSGLGSWRAVFVFSEWRVTYTQRTTAKCEIWKRKEWCAERAAKRRDEA